MLQASTDSLRCALIEADRVDGMVALPGQLFNRTQILVRLWFFAKSQADGDTFEEKMPRLVAERQGQFAESARLERSRLQLNALATAQSGRRSFGGGGFAESTKREAAIRASLKRLDCNL